MELIELLFLLRNNSDHNLNFLLVFFKLPFINIVYKTRVKMFRGFFTSQECPQMWNRTHLAPGGSNYACTLVQISRETGLGLVIAKHIVESHGGHISLVSERDKGTSFYFNPPL